MYICNALLDYEYSVFSLTIIEYIEITNKSKEKARKIVLLREQNYLDTLLPEYNILKETSSSLGYKHTEETIKN